MTLQLFFVPECCERVWNWGKGIQVWCTNTGVDRTVVCRLHKCLLRQHTPLIDSFQLLVHIPLSPIQTTDQQQQILVQKTILCLKEQIDRYCNVSDPNKLPVIVTVTSPCWDLKVDLVQIFMWVYIQKRFQLRMYLWWGLCTLCLHACQVSYRRRLGSLLLCLCDVFEH